VGFLLLRIVATPAAPRHAERTPTHERDPAATHR
jgi:hypothetical protein